MSALRALVWIALGCHWATSRRVLAKLKATAIPLLKEGVSTKQEKCGKLGLDKLRDSLTGKDVHTRLLGPHVGSTLRWLPYNESELDAGATWCESCVTMAGTLRVEDVRNLVQRTIEKGVPGSFLEAGTWRGGSSIMARAVQKCMGEGVKRKVHVCDSFHGLPKASTKNDRDLWSKMTFLEVSREQVQENFKRYGMLDDGVEFHKGYFMLSLPPLRERFLADGTQLAVVRGDGDMYESYLDILFNLYDFVPVGGYFICDDCGYISVADRAIKLFREMHSITAKMESNPSLRGRFWRKGEGEAPVFYAWYLQWNATRK